MPAALCAPGGTGGAADGFYIWPYVCADQDAAGLPFVHLVGTETTPAAGDVQSLVYYRSNAGNTAPFGTCGKLIDSTYTISPVVVQDPASQKVAIVYSKPMVYGTGSSQVTNNVVYLESTNLGATWGAPVNITNYLPAGDPNVSLSNAYTEVMALYSAGVLHIIWNTQENDGAGSFYNQASKLFHWDNVGNCISMLISADNFQSCGPGAWNRNIAKIGLSECTVGGVKKLYATYTYFNGDDTGVPNPADCSAAGWANGEIYAQVSETLGLTWGAPTNLTNTTSPACAAGACKSEHWSSPASYVSDSLRIQYIWDKDAGGIVQTEGSWTNNPVMNLATPCFAMSTYRSLSATPSEFTYPQIHTDPSTTTNVDLVLTNSGNANANYTRTVSYTNGSGWLSFNTAASGVVPAGCTNSQTIVVTATGPTTQALYKANVTFTYEGGATLVIPVELWNFDPFFLPQYGQVRTGTNKVNVQQTSRIGGEGSANPTLTYFADSSTYLFDGSLVLGNAANNMSFQIFEGGTGAGPTLTNPYGYLYGNSATQCDSTSSTSWRRAWGEGLNKDSTLKFTVEWYAPKHPDSIDFYIAHFNVQKGPKDPTGTVSGLMIGYAVDFDVPTDTAGSSDNRAGFDEDLQMVYQQGLAGTDPLQTLNDRRFAGIAALRDDNTPIVGGFSQTNTSSVYPLNGYSSSLLWSRMQSQLGFSDLGADSIIDRNSVLVIDKGVSITPTTNYKFTLIIASQYKTSGSLVGLQTAVAKAKKFACDHWIEWLFGPKPAWCVSGCNTCGDANSDGFISITDAVALIGYVFNGVPVPADCGYAQGKGDFNGDGFISITDAVACIGYVFNGTPCPKCMGMPCWTTK
jgi:hypothetical protein